MLKLTRMGGYLSAKYGLTTTYPPVPLALSLSVPANGQAYPSGSSVTATASVIPGAGTGPYDVQFYLKTGAGAFAAEGSPVVGAAGSTFDLALGALADETYQVYAVITDATTATATSAINTFTVQAAASTTTVLATSGSPSTYGGAVTFTATVSPVPSGGTVQFYDDASPIGGPVAVNTGDGTAQYTTTLLGSPSNSITADYSGHGIYLSSSASPLTQTVDQAVLTVTADNKIRSPGTANPTFTYKITGYQNGEDAGSAGITGTPGLTCSTAPDNSIVEGPFTIDCTTGDLAAVNYSFATVNGVLVVQSGAPPVANNMVCWFDASSIAVADGAQVDTWNDLSGNGHKATRISGSPTFAENDIKYDASSSAHPGVHFRGNNGIFTIAGGMFVKEQYVVVRSPNPTWTSMSFLGRKSADFLTARASSYNTAGNTTGFWQDHHPLTVVKNGYAPASPAPTVVNNNNGQDKYGNSSNGCRFAIDDITDYMILKIVVNDSASPANLAQYPYYEIGRNEGVGSGEFDIAEIIGYGAALSAGEEEALGAYLENKYGIPSPNYADESPQAFFVDFNINGLPTRVDQARREIIVTAVSPVDISVLVPTFTLADGATCTVNGTPITSGVTEVNFSPAHYIVTSSDSMKTADYTVTIDWSAPTVVTVDTPALDVSGPSTTGLEILNTGTQVEANHFGSSLTALTVNGVAFGTSGDARLTQSPGGSTTNTDGQTRVPLLDDTTDFGKLMRTYRWGGGSTLKLDIPGLTPGHTYRFQWISSSPRGGNISVEGSPSVPQAPVTQPESNYPRVLAFTWVAADPTANVVVTRQSGSYSTDNEILWNGYALHDMGVILPPAIISGVTASPSIPAGAATVALGGTVSDGGAVFAADGDVASVTINGATYYAPISGGAGAFSIAFPTASLPEAVYPITYSYVGDGTTLFAAADETSTSLTVTAGGNNYVDWIAGFSVGGQTAFGDDPDGDGNANGVENFLGTDPSVSTAGQSAGVKSGNTFTFTHPKNATPADDITAAYQWSTDLATFNADGATVGATTVDFSSVVTAGIATVTATITGTVPDALFANILVTSP